MRRYSWRSRVDSRCSLVGTLGTAAQKQPTAAWTSCGGSIGMSSPSGRCRGVLGK